MQKHVDAQRGSTFIWTVTRVLELPHRKEWDSLDTSCLRYLNPVLLGISFILMHMAGLILPHRGLNPMDKQVGWCAPSPLHPYVALTLSLAPITSHCFPILMTAPEAQATIRPVSCLFQRHGLSRRHGTDSEDSLCWWELGQPVLQMDLEVSAWY